MNIIEELYNTKLLRVTGSTADGTQNDASDIDFWVKPDKPDQHKKTRHFQVIVDIVEKHGLSWDSCICGHIKTRGAIIVNGHFRRLEFSELFVHRKGRVAEVMLEGFPFKTW
jgi:predicted nucleotidyltransferase